MLLLPFPLSTGKHKLMTILKTTEQDSRKTRPASPDTWVPAKNSEAEKDSARVFFLLRILSNVLPEI